MAHPIYDRGDALKVMFEAASKKYAITYLDRTEERLAEWKAEWDKAYTTHPVYHFPSPEIYFKWVEDSGLVITDEKDYKQWLASNPSLVVFEAEIKGVKIETVFVPDVLDENNHQVPIFETTITTNEHTSMSRSFNVQEAEAKHVKVLARLLREGRAKE